MADAASIEQMLKDEASRTLGRYQRFEDVAAAQAALTRSVAAAVAALAKQITTEDAADDAALQALIKSVNDNVDALETVIKTPPVVEPPKA